MNFFTSKLLFNLKNFSVLSCKKKIFKKPTIYRYSFYEKYYSNINDKKSDFKDVIIENS